MTGPLLLLVLLPLGALTQEQERREVSAVITYTSGRGYYLDAGRDSGLAVGSRGEVWRGERRIGTLEIRHLSSKFAFAESVYFDVENPPRPGDQVRFEVTVGGESEEEPFVPLLTTSKSSSSGPIWNGSIRAGTTFTRDSKHDRDYSFSSLSSSGSVERAFSGPWSVEWDLDVNYRDGDGYEENDDYQEARVRPQLFVVRRHFEDGSVFGVGRIEPLALPSIGRLDGAYGEVQIGEGLRLGSIVGLRPDWDDLDLSGDDLVVSGYGVFRADLGEAVRLWSSAGFLASWFEGAADQQAFLLDARLDDIEGGHWLSVSSQTDYYSGSEDSRSGVELTRIDLLGGASLTDALGVEAGWRHHELADTDYDREEVPDDDRYNRGFDRAFFGLQEELPFEITLGQEVAVISGSDVDAELQVVLRAQKRGLPWHGVFDASVYNIEGYDSDGLGGNLGLSVLPADWLYLRVDYDVSILDLDVGDDAGTSVLSALADWRISQRTSFSTRASYAFGDSVDALTVNVALTWRF